MDDGSDRVKKNIKGLVLVTGLLVLLGAGCAKAPETIGKVQQNQVKENAPTSSAMEYKYDDNCSEGSNSPVASGAFEQFLKDFGPSSYERNLDRLCYDKNEGVVYFSIMEGMYNYSPSGTMPEINLPSDGRAAVSIKRAIGFWKPAANGQAERFVVSPIFVTGSAQEVPLVSNLKLTATSTGYAITVSVDGTGYMQNEELGLWSAEISFLPELNKLELTQYSNLTAETNK